MLCMLFANNRSKAMAAMYSKYITSVNKNDSYLTIDMKKGTISNITDEIIENNKEIEEFFFTKDLWKTVTIS